MRQDVTIAHRFAANPYCLPRIPQSEIVRFLTAPFRQGGLWRLRFAYPLSKGGLGCAAPPSTTLPPALLRSLGMTVFSLHVQKAFGFQLSERKSGYKSLWGSRPNTLPTLKKTADSNSIPRDGQRGFSNFHSFHHGRLNCFVRAKRVSPCLRRRCFRFCPDTGFVMTSIIVSPRGIAVLVLLYAIKYDK